MKQTTAAYVLGGLLIASLCTSGYSLYKSESDTKKILASNQLVIEAINNKQFAVSDNDATLIAAKSSIYNQQLKNEMEIALSKNEQAFQIYSDSYINELVANTKNIVSTLYPEDSIAETSKNRYDAMMSEIDYENHNRAVNTGVIEEPKIITKTDEEELFIRLSVLFPQKSKEEILQLMKKQ